MATRDAVFPAGRGPARPSSSPPAASARLHATGGSLPPVRLTDRDRAGCPLRRIAGRLDGDVQRPRVRSRLPVQRRAPGRCLSRSCKTLARATASPGTPCRRGPTPSRWSSRTDSPARRASPRARRIRRRRVLQETAPWSAPWPTPWSPSTARPLARRHDVRPVRQAGPHPVVAEYLPVAHRSRREHQLHRGRHAARHDLPDAARPGRRNGLRPAGVHHRQLAGQPEFPHLHRGAATGRRDRPEPGRDLPRREPRTTPSTPWRPT